MAKKKIIVAITGASGVGYGIRILDLLRCVSNVEVHTIISNSGIKVLEIEALTKNFTIPSFCKLSTHIHPNDDIGSCVASGSFGADGMIVMPCTIKTLSSIVNSYNSTLITRAADVILKEGKKLILGVRETPLHAGHLELLTKASRNGATIMPPMPSFYNKPRFLQDIITQVAARTLQQLNIKVPNLKQWEGHN